jgi:hypothetical protein
MSSRESLIGMALFNYPQLDESYIEVECPDEEDGYPTSYSRFYSVNELSKAIACANETKGDIYFVERKSLWKYCHSGDSRVSS